MEEYEKQLWTSEVKFLKAYYHFFLMRLYGPIPIIRENLPISASVDEVRVYRDPIDDVVNYIVELIDEAAAGLPDKIESMITDAGRITRPMPWLQKQKCWFGLQVLYSMAIPITSISKIKEVSSWFRQRKTIQNGNVPLQQ